MTEVQNIPLNEIRSPDAPVRTERDEQALEQLAANIRSGGVDTPIKVRPNGDGYEVVYGDRRYRAAKMAGLDSIPAIVEEMDDETALIKAFAENQLREDMTALDKARAIRRILEATGWPTLELERRGICHHSTANNLLYYLDEFERGAIPPIDDFRLARDEGVGKAVKVRQAFINAGLLDDDGSVEMRRRIIEKAAREGLTIRQTRKIADMVINAEDKGHRESIIKTEYDDPMFDRLVAARRAIWKKESRDEKRKERPDVKHEPVQEYLAALRAFALDVNAAIREAERGMFAEESVHLLSRWHYELIDSLNKLEKTISE